MGKPERAQALAACTGGVMTMPRLATGSKDASGTLWGARTGLRGDRMARACAIMGSLALTVFVVGAGWADTDLTGGVFICHHPPALAYTDPPPVEGWCQEYLDSHAIASCEEQNPSLETPGPFVWFLLSAWSGERTFCGAQFGFGDYDPGLCEFTSWGYCVPGGGLEIPTGGWPGPNEGTSVVTTDAPWAGNFVPVYFFAGYSYGGAGGRIPIEVNPATGSAGWGNCETPPETFAPECSGALGVFEPGIECCPTTRHACCMGAECYLRTEPECTELGGMFHPEWDSCDERPCPAACCVGAECYLASERECADIGGVFHPEWDSCAEYPCPAACCLGDRCRLASEGWCLSRHGEFHPEWTSCEGDPCLGAPVHVCCDGAACCRILTEWDCWSVGGEYHPEWDSCDPNPCPDLPHACCVGGDCYMVSEEDCDQLGGEFHSSWWSCTSNPCDGSACCFAQECLVLTEGDCSALDGVFYWYISDCEPNRCPELMGVCCVGTECYVVHERECYEMGGAFHDNLDSCEERDNPCTPEAVCCVGENCQVLSEEECGAAGGEWHGEWESCDPNPCEGGTPAERMSWGRVKTIYR